MLARALHSPVHRLAGEPGVPELGVSLQLQRRLQQGPVPELPQEPLQQTRLRRQQDPPRQERQDVPQDPRHDAVQGWAKPPRKCITNLHLVCVLYSSLSFLFSQCFITRLSCICSATKTWLCWSSQWKCLCSGRLMRGTTSLPLCESPYFNPGLYFSYLIFCIF